MPSLLILIQHLFHSEYLTRLDFEILIITIFSVVVVKEEEGEGPG